MRVTATLLLLVVVWSNGAAQERAPADRGLVFTNASGGEITVELAPAVGTGSCSAIDATTAMRHTIPAGRAFRVIAAHPVCWRRVQPDGSGPWERVLPPWTSRQTITLS